MTIKPSLIFAFVAAAAFPARAHPAGPAPEALLDRSVRFEEQDQTRERQERDAERRQRDREREVEVYEQGNEALDQQRWDRAIAHFTRVAEMKSTRADGALYWKAYAQNRQGQRAEALGTIAELSKAYPDSRYLKQAQALELEIRNAAGQPVRPESQSDEELKLMAIQHLQHADPERAVPLLEQLLEGSASPRVKTQALFVLAQSASPRAREVMKQVAQGRSTPELQLRAIHYLGVHGGRESRAALAEVYSATTDVDVKKRILRAFMVAGETDRLFAAAQSEPTPELRDEAVRQLGVMGAHDQLWQLYQKETSVDVRKRIITAMFTGGDAARMIELAKSEKDPDLRRIAVRNLGLMGTKGTGDALVEIYVSDKDPATRKGVVEALFLQGNATSLVSLARKEQDVEMKRQLVQKLSLMQDKAATDYMLELLAK